MKLTATMMLSVDGVHQARRPATASPTHVSSIAAASKPRVTGTQTENMAFYPRTFLRLLSSWGARGDVSRDCEGSGTYVLHWLLQLCLAPRPGSVRRLSGVP